MVSKNEKKKEGFSNLKSGDILKIVHLVIGIFALFVSIKCNKGFHLGSFLLACCCPEFYLIYIAATKGFNFCI